MEVFIGVQMCMEMCRWVHGGAQRGVQVQGGVQRCVGVLIWCMEVCRGVHGWVHGDVWRCAEGVQRYMEVCRGVHRSA